jgi:hypothetical protein
MVLHALFKSKLMILCDLTCLTHGQTGALKKTATIILVVSKLERLANETPVEDNSPVVTP